MTLRRSLSLAVAALAVPAMLAACAAGPAASLPPIPSEAPATPTAAPTHPGPTYPPGCPTAQPAALTADDVRTVTITTDKGDIVMEIKGALSPVAAGNFVELASCGYYDMVVFHRLVPGFVIQGGDGQFGRAPDVFPDLVGSGGPPYTIADEPVTTAYKRGTVAMARTAEPNSVGSQFFIVLDDAAAQALGDPQYNNYQIIGSVTAGMDAVDAIAAMPNSGTPSNSATDPIPMTKVTVTTP
ncbi:MAG: peptidylprolyl isomerase [Candidatus Limnocylindrales bacterium]